MAKRRYTPEFKARMVDLVRGGRSPSSLAREFEPTSQAIGRWVRQADRDEGRRTDGRLTTDERQEVQRLRRSGVAPSDGFYLVFRSRTPPPERRGLPCRRTSRRKFSGGDRSERSTCVQPSRGPLKMPWRR